MVDLAVQESKKTVFLIVGESGSGKDSFVSKICNETNLTQIISYTTRQRRNGEGNTHVFISDEDVEQYRDSIIAYTEINDCKYFCTLQQLYEADFYVIDPLGIKYLKEKVTSDNIRFVTIYINVPFEIRKHRAINIRGDNPKTFINRHQSESGQFINFKAQAKFDYAISNINFDKAYKVLKNIIQIELEEDNND
jgi:guanylate kinase